MMGTHAKLVRLLFLAVIVGILAGTMGRAWQLTPAYFSLMTLGLMLLVALFFRLAIK